MNSKAVAEHIVAWMRKYAIEARVEGFVIGVSGGIDSAVCSVLAAMTELPTLCVAMPIHQPQSHVSRAEQHISMLSKRFSNITSVEIDLTTSFDQFSSLFGQSDESKSQLANANTRSRLRMTTLYHLATLHNRLVVGTGNKIEDFGVGFFTKYGDGGVDISPIADLVKTEVFALGAYLGVSESILSAPPADGLFGDDRTDEQQIGATYPELEWAMAQFEKGAGAEQFTGRDRAVFDIYSHRHRVNRHKMELPPYPVVSESLKTQD